MALTPAEKQRRYRQKLKLDPEKFAEAKRKHRERYHANKKLIKDMTEREHRSAKRKWKTANKKRRERQQAARVALESFETPSSTPRSGTTVSPTSRGRRQVRRDRSALYRRNVKLQEELEQLKKKYNKYKKRYQRIKKSVPKEAENDKYNILTNAIKDHYKKIKNIKDKKLVKQIFQGGSILNSRMKTAIVRETLGIDQIKIRQITPKLPALRETIKSFFDRDDVSRATAGKRETVTYKTNKKQKRYLLDSMRSLYRTFKKENPKMQCSYSYFAKHRPFYVKAPTVDGRDTCLCKTHANAQYLFNTLYRHKIISTSNMNNFIESTVCCTDSRACMTAKCNNCNNKQVPYQIPNELTTIKWPQWTRKSEIIDKSGKRVKITKTVKEEIKGTVTEMLDTFNKTIIKLKTHIYNIRTQFRSYRAAIDNLRNDEIVMHIDFSENYSCKNYEEVQSHHFGGSRKQVTLHTGVMYLKAERDVKPTTITFCSVSGNNLHNPVSIWAHLHPIIKELKTNYPHVKTIHFFSDGPATQYRQKLNFYFICTKIFEEYQFDRVTWNFFEAGHGKGAADGVGGFLKRAADKKVATGTDVSDAETFFVTLKESSKIQLYFITDEDIEKIQQTVPENITPLQGTMKVHQIFTDAPRKLQYRELSCFCQRGFCACLNPKLYQPVLCADENVTDSMSENEVLCNIANIISRPRKTYYDCVFSSSSSDDEPLSNMKKTSLSNVEDIPSVSNVQEQQLIDKENIHPSKISNGVYVTVKFTSAKNQQYVYLGIAQSEVDDEGDVKIMFYRCVDSTGMKFKSVETDVSFEPYENILEIVPNPRIVTKGKRVLYCFDQPLNIFER